MRTLVICLASLLASGCASGAATVRDARTTVAAPGDTGLVSLAGRISRAAPRVGEAWPGYWPADRPFALVRAPDTVLLVTPRTPPAEYTPLQDASTPAVLRGRLYLRRGYAQELGPSGRTRFGVGPDTVPALGFPGGEPVFARFEYYYHEAFHGFQRRAFAPAPGEPETEMRQPSVDPALIAAPEFRALGEVERRVLAAALGTQDPAALRSLVRGYFAVRERRTGHLPTVRAVERKMERREGTAEMVGCHAAAIASGERTATECVLSELSEDMSTWTNFPESDARLMRWRHYGTGAALGLLLDRFAVPGWRGAVERGAAPDELLSAAAGFDAVRDQALAEPLLRSYGPAAQP